MLDKKGRSKGYGYVDMDSDEALTEAMKMMSVISQMNCPIQQSNTDPMVGSRYTNPNVFQNAAE